MENPEKSTPIQEERLPSHGLLGFYDSLRARAVAGPEKRLSKRGLDFLLLVPDVFMLVARLAVDGRVPRESRALFAGSLAYFLLPLDLLPEAMLGISGFADDLVLALAVLNHAFGRDVEDLAVGHWSGSQEVRSVVADVLGTAHVLLSGRVYERLVALLRKRGIHVSVPDESL